MRKGSKYTSEQLVRISLANKRIGLARRGISHSAEHNRKVSEANKGQIPWIKGRKQTEEHIAKRVGARIKNGTTSKVTAPRRENHYLWKKDRTLLKDDSHERGGQLHREWSMNVKNRDSWKCRIADENCSGNPVAHHILSWGRFSELRYNIKNGITLCHHHHPRKRVDEERMIPVFTKLVAVQMH